MNKRITELPEQVEIHGSDVFACDSLELDQTGKVTFEQLCEEIKKAIDVKDLLLRAHPVGSYYMSDKNTDPSELFGGTWTRISNRFIYASGKYQTGYTGGSETVLLTGEQTGLKGHSHEYHQPSVKPTSAEVALTNSAHEHEIYVKQIHAMQPTTATNPVYGIVEKGSTTVKTKSDGKHSHSSPTHTHQLQSGAISPVTSKDASQAHNNMPPFIATNVWRRIS